MSLNPSFKAASGIASGLIAICLVAINGPASHAQGIYAPPTYSMPPSGTYTGPPPTPAVTPQIPLVPQQQLRLTTPVHIPERAVPIVPTDQLQLFQQQISVTVPRKEEKGFQFALTNCQGVSDDHHSGAVVYPVRGSVWSVHAAEANSSPSEFELAAGRMLVIADKMPVRVKAGGTVTRVAASASAIVEKESNGQVRIYSLITSNSQPPVTVELRDSLEPVGLSTGEALIMAEDNLSQEELIPVNGLAMTPVEGRIAQEIKDNARLFRFSLRQMASRKLLIACRSVEINPVHKPARLLRKTFAEIVAQAESEPFPTDNRERSQADAPAVHQAVPVSHRSVRTQPFLPQAVESNVDSTLVASPQSIYQRVSADRIELVLGQLLVRSRQPLQIVSGRRSVHISKGAAAIVSNNGAALKVINITDRQRGTVAVTFASQRVHVGCGRELVVSERPASLSEIFDQHKIGHKGLAADQLPDGTWITRSQVHLPDLLASHRLIRPLRHDQAGRHGRQLITEIAKTAAILSLMGSTAGDYHRGLPEDEGLSTRFGASICRSCAASTRGGTGYTYHGEQR